MDYKIIKIKMIENDISLKELAEKINVNINTVSRWINGKNLENTEKFIEMLSILNISIEEIKKEK